MLRRIVNRFIIQGSGGYELQIHGELHPNDGLQSLSPKTSREKRVKAEWDGFRLSLGAGCLLGKRNKHEYVMEFSMKILTILAPFLNLSKLPPFRVS